MCVTERLRQRTEKMIWETVGVADECVMMVDQARLIKALLVSMEMPPGMVVEGGWSPVAVPTWCL